MTTNEFKASVLTAMLSEDRKEIRDIKAGLYRVVSFLVASAFAVTAHLLKENAAIGHQLKVCLVADLAALAFVWTLYLGARKDLRHARQALRRRQDLVKDLADLASESVDPFPDASRTVVDMKDREILWVTIISTVAIIAKAVVMLVASGPSAGR